jgi:UDP-N-acetylmuramate dehydrogenase
MNQLYEPLKQLFKDKLKEMEPLALYTTYKIGGPADLFYSANTSEELISIVTQARILKIPFFILGGGSNVLISDSGFRGLVIKNNTGTITIRGMKGNMKGVAKKSTVYLEADSGVPMNKLVRFSLEEGLSGLEMHLGLPGSVGGAVYMNSKWMKPVGFVGDVIHQATVLTENNQLKQVEKEYFHFSYGSSILQKNSDVLIRVVFALVEEDKDILWARANDSVEHRKATQPQGVRTAGCVFKNITAADALNFGTPDHATSAGYLLDKAGCKGLSVGGAEVSKQHANFITTHKEAKASDVIELIHIMKQNVKHTFGVTLKEEILLVGEFS